MGKPKGKSRSGGGRVTKSKPVYDIEDILAKAEECMDEYKYELASKFCERALEIGNYKFNILMHNDNSVRLVKTLSGPSAASSCQPI